MKSLFYSCFLMVSFLIIGCNKSETKNETTNKSEIEIKPEITNVIASFWRVQNDDSFTIEYENIKENKLFWCYDVEELLKIEILGNIPKASIVYTDNNGKEYELLKNQDIVSNYTIVPLSKYNALNGGIIKISSNNNLIKEFNIEYDGCQ